jgi:hypothetical protein
MPPFKPNPYTPRTIRPRDPIRHHDWRLKSYDVLFNTDPIDESTYAHGISLALQSLPTPAVTDRRPGVGFLIRHHGRTVHYIVLSWWDNENELLQRVFVRTFDEGAAWLNITGQGSFCVWDAQIIWHEREAYVRHVLAEAPDLDAYLRAACNQFAAT